MVHQPEPKPEADRPVDFVKKVGRGRTLSQHLSAAEARTAFSLLLEGAFAPAQFGAFLQALRIKELTQEEIDTLAGVFRSRMPALAPLRGQELVRAERVGAERADDASGRARTLVLNLASDTGRKGGMASLLAAARLHRFGVGVGMVRSTPVLSGNSASFDRTLELARLAHPGFGRGGEPSSLIADCADLVPGLKALDALRGELGFQSCLHTAEKLVNPWPASPMLLGISHKHYALRMAATLATLGLDGSILLGNHGTVDLVLHKETELVTVRSGDIREESFAPANLGLVLASDVYSLGRFGDWKAWIEDPGSQGGAALEQVVLYHLAVFLWAAGAAPDPAAGLRAARAAP